MDEGSERYESQYQSYLLRLWRGGEGKTWRAMLEQVDSRQRFGFTDLESMYAFLCEQTGKIQKATQLDQDERVSKKPDQL